MSHYIEIDSTYRDRNTYQNPSNFVINVKNAGDQGNVFNSVNPLSKSYPIYNFQGPHPELLGIDKDFKGNDTQFILGSQPKSKFGASSQTSTHFVNHVNNYTHNNNNVITNVQNPWQINSNVENSYGPGTNDIPHLDGLSIDNSHLSRDFYKNVTSDDTLFPSIYQNTIDENRSYSGFPYSSSQSNYYNGLVLSRYKDNIDHTNPNETMLIYNYKGADFSQINTIIENKVIKYDSQSEVLINDLDTAQISYNSSRSSCELEMKFSDNWNKSNYWTINNGSVLSVSNPEIVTIHGGININNYYVGMYLEDCTMPISDNLNISENRFKKIVSYDGLTRKAILESGFKSADASGNFIEDGSYHLMNINSDRINPFNMNIGEGDSDLGIFLSDQFNISGTEFQWNKNETNYSANGWIPQDRYRIRNEIPTVMGWGINEDRDGARVRSSNTNSNTLFSGTGPEDGQNGVAYIAEIVDNGSGFEINNNEVYCATRSEYSNTSDSVFIQIDQINANGGILNAKIVWGGRNYNAGEKLIVHNSTNDIGSSVKILNLVEIKNGDYYKDGIIYTLNKNDYSILTNNEFINYAINEMNSIEDIIAFQVDYTSSSQTDINTITFKTAKLAENLQYNENSITGSQIYTISDIPSDSDFHQYRSGIINVSSSNNAVIQISKVGQSIDISNGFIGNTTQTLSHEYDAYKGQLFYVPSEGPERKSSQFLTKYNLTGHFKTIQPYSKGADPPYMNQYPLKVNENNTGHVLIDAYLTTSANRVRKNINTTDQWILSQNPGYNGVGCIITNNGFTTPITGNTHDGSNSNQGKSSVYNVSKQFDNTFTLTAAKINPDTVDLTLYDNLEISTNHPLSRPHKTRVLLTDEQAAAVNISISDNTNLFEGDLLQGYLNSNGERIFIKTVLSNSITLTSQLPVSIPANSVIIFTRNLEVYEIVMDGRRGKRPEIEVDKIYKLDLVDSSLSQFREGSPIFKFIGASTGQQDNINANKLVFTSGIVRIKTIQEDSNLNQSIIIKNNDVQTEIKFFQDRTYYLYKNSDFNFTNILSLTPISVKYIETIGDTPNYSYKFQSIDSTNIIIDQNDTIWITTADGTFLNNYNPNHEKILKLRSTLENGSLFTDVTLRWLSGDGTGRTEFQIISGQETLRNEQLAPNNNPHNFASEDQIVYIYATDNFIKFKQKEKLDSTNNTFTSVDTDIVSNGNVIVNEIGSLGSTGELQLRLNQIGNIEIQPIHIIETKPHIMNKLLIFKYNPILVKDSTVDTSNINNIMVSNYSINGSHNWQSQEITYNNNISHNISCSNHGNKIYVAGSINETSLTNTYTNTWLAKYHANGSRLWTQVYTGNDTSVDESIISLTNTDDGYYIYALVDMSNSENRTLLTAVITQNVTGKTISIIPTNSDLISFDYNRIYYVYITNTNVQKVEFTGYTTNLSGNPYTYNFKSDTNFTGLENASTTNVNISIKTATSRIVKYNEFGDKLNDISIRNIIFSQNLYKRDYQFNQVTTINNCRLYYDQTIATDNIEIMKTRVIEKFSMYIKGIYRETETDNFSILIDGDTTFNTGEIHELQWNTNTSIEFNDIDITPIDIISNKDGTSLYITGYTSTLFFNDSDKDLVNKSYVILKIDNNGTYQWIKQHGGKGDDIPTAITTTETGDNIYVCGNSTDIINYLTPENLSMDSVFFEDGKQYDFRYYYYYNNAYAESTIITWPNTTSNKLYKSEHLNLTNTEFVNMCYEKLITKINTNDRIKAFTLYYTDVTQNTISYAEAITFSDNLSNIITFSSNHQYSPQVYIVENEDDISLLQINGISPLLFKSNIASSNIWFSKFNENGNKQWEKHIFNNSNSGVNDIVTSADGERIYICGYTYGNMEQFANTGDKDIWLAKYDSNGEQLWLQQIGTNVTDEAISITTNNAGTIIYVNGNTNGNLIGTTVNNTNNTWTASYNELGNQLWIKQYRSNNNDYVSGICTNNSGDNLYTVGYTNNNTSNFGIPYNTTNVNYDEEYHVKIENNQFNLYKDGIEQSTVSFEIEKTYKFDISDISNKNNILRFSDNSSNKNEYETRQYNTQGSENSYILFSPLINTVFMFCSINGYSLGNKYNGTSGISVTGASGIIEPVIQSVTLSPNKSVYQIGDTIDITIIFNINSLIVDNTYYNIRLNLSNNKKANYNDIPRYGVNYIKYIYNVSEFDEPTTNLSITGHDGFILYGNYMYLMNNIYTYDLGIGITTIKVNNIQATDGIYGINDDIIITINFNQNMTVSSSTILTLSNGSTAVYNNGSETSTVVFKYTVIENDSYSSDLNIVSYTGSIQNNIQQDLEQSQITTDLGNIQVDADTPDIISVNAENGEYSSNDELSISVRWDKNIFVDFLNLPLLTLSNGSQAIYNKGNSSTELTFIYTVSSTDTVSSDLSVINYTGSITDSAGNNAQQVVQDLGNVSIQPSNFSECIIMQSIVNIVNSSGNKYTFNNDLTYNSNKKYGLTRTQNDPYIFKNIPIEHPMAILNEGNSNITYTGDQTKKYTKPITGTTADGEYDFYYGDITVNVSGNFGQVSVYCFYHGYMGGENLLEYSLNCPVPSIQIGPFQFKYNDSTLIKTNLFNRFSNEDSTVTVEYDINDYEYTWVDLEQTDSSIYDIYNDSQLVGNVTLSQIITSNKYIFNFTSNGYAFTSSQTDNTISIKSRTSKMLFVRTNRDITFIDDSYKLIQFDFITLSDIHIFDKNNGDKKLSNISQSRLQFILNNLTYNLDINQINLLYARLL